MPHGRNRGTRSAHPDRQYERWARRLTISVETLLARTLHYDWVPFADPLPVRRWVVVLSLQLIVAIDRDISESELDGVIASAADHLVRTGRALTR